jgi:hypothetical protein
VDVKNCYFSYAISYVDIFSRLCRSVTQVQLHGETSLLLSYLVCPAGVPFFPKFLIRSTVGWFAHAFMGELTKPGGPFPLVYTILSTGLLFLGAPDVYIVMTYVCKAFFNISWDVKLCFHPKKFQTQLSQFAYQAFIVPFILIGLNYITAYHRSCIANLTFTQSQEECRLLFPQRRMRMSNQGVLPRSFAYKMFPHHHCVSTRALSTVKLE